MDNYKIINGDLVKLVGDAFEDYSLGLVKEMSSNGNRFRVTATNDYLVRIISESGSDLGWLVDRDDVELVVEVNDKLFEI